MAFFSDEELACKCDRGEKCDAKPVDLETRMKAEGARREDGEPWVITSGSRCLYWNEKVGGAPDSYHPKGMAIDVQATTPARRGKIMKMAIKHGFTGIGIAKTFIHLDTRPLPPGVELWVFTY